MFSSCVRKWSWEDIGVTRRVEQGGLKLLKRHNHSFRNLHLVCRKWSASISASKEAFMEISDSRFKFIRLQENRITAERKK
jgi:hypothetical protein